MITVERIKRPNSTTESVQSTYDNLMSKIFPDMQGRVLNGVKFDYLSNHSMFYPEMTGVSLEAGYFTKLRRRILITKDGKFDDVKLKEKYEELRKHAIIEKEKEDAADNTRNKTHEAYQSIVSQLRKSEEEWRVEGLWDDSPTTVKVIGMATWQQLRDLSELLGQEFRVKVESKVTLDKAVQAHRILYPKSE